MSDKKTITEMLQYAVSIVEQQIAERGDMRLGEKEGEHWEVLLIACGIKDGRGTLHASSSEGPEQSCYIAAQFLARAEDPRFSRHAPPPPKVV